MKSEAEDQVAKGNEGQQRQAVGTRPLKEMNHETKARYQKRMACIGP